MNTELLMEFLTLADCLNFSEASQKLNTTQPTLSRHIVQLEYELEVQLFKRDRQSVSLTEVGKMFLPEASAIVERCEKAALRIREYKDGMRGSLTIGYQWVYNDWLWLQTLYEFQKQYPQIAAKPVSYSNSEQLNNDLFRGTVDIAMTLRNDRNTSSDFRSLPLHSVPLMVVMRNDHSLAKREIITMSELKGERLIFPQANNYLGLHAQLSSLFQTYSISPLVSYSAERIEDALLRVQMEHLIALVPECHLPNTGMPGLCILSLEKMDDAFQLIILSRSDNNNPAIKIFFNVCRNEVGK